MAKAKAGKKATKKRESVDEEAAKMSGTSIWRDGPKLASGGDLSEMSKVRVYSVLSRPPLTTSPTVRHRHHDVLAHHQDPELGGLRSQAGKSARGSRQILELPSDVGLQLVVSNGALEGKRILVLEPVQPFRILDLPPEIRIMIYQQLMSEPEPIEAIAHADAVAGCWLRVVRVSHRDRAAHLAQGLTFDARSGKYIGQGPSDFGVARVNKQMAAEALPVMYGDNTFKLTNTLLLDLFLERIESQRAYLQHVVVFGGLVDPRVGRRLADKFLTCGRLREITVLSHNIVVALGDDPVGSLRAALAKVG